MSTNKNTKVKEIYLNAPEQKIQDNIPFPYILSPADDSDLDTIEKTLEFLENQKHVLEDKLLKHGAVLFRGFPINTPNDFDHFVKSFDYEPLPYVGGAAPRTHVTGNVFTSNESPPEALIPFHHEMAQVPTYPAVLFFYCETSPPEGGQTPLVLSHLVYRKMTETCKEFVEKLEQKGVKYTRVLPNGNDPSSPIGRGWQSTYDTNDKLEAERKALNLVASVEWLPDGCMKTVTDVLPAVREDSRTGRKTWFNSIIAVYRGWKDCRNTPETSITFGDGTSMPAETMDKLEGILNELAVDFTWKRGDVVMVDNKQVLHGRRSFVPPRRILATLCK